MNLTRLKYLFHQTKLSRRIFGQCDGEADGRRCVLSSRHYTYCEDENGFGWSYSEDGTPDYGELSCDWSKQ